MKLIKWLVAIGVIGAILWVLIGDYMTTVNRQNGFVGNYGSRELKGVSPAIAQCSGDGSCE